MRRLAVSGNRTVVTQHHPATNRPQALTDTPERRGPRPDNNGETQLGAGYAGTFAAP